MLWLSYLPKLPIWDFRLLISASRLTNFLASLESLFLPCLSCLLVKGASNSGCLASFFRSHSGSQVVPLEGALEGDICRGRLGSQVDISGGGGGGPLGGPHFAEVSGPDVHYSGEKLLTQLFSIENNLSIHAL